MQPATEGITEEVLSKICTPQGKREAANKGLSNGLFRGYVAREKLLTI
jgi:hypothetical protein